MLVDTSIKMVLEILFFFLSNADIDFEVERLTWKKNSATEVLAITGQIQLIDKHEFAKPALDKNLKTFVIYVVALKTAMPIYSSRITQIASPL